MTIEEKVEQAVKVANELNYLRDREFPKAIGNESARETLATAVTIIEKYAMLVRDIDILIKVNKMMEEEQ